MTVGQRIMKLRSIANISQEELSERLGVSRQTVSKWELDQALPQIEKIIVLAKLFEVTTDELLVDGVKEKAPKQNSLSGKYFGTDGFRGESNVELTSLHAYKVGRFLGWYYSKNSPTERARIVIGKDTRRSSYMLEYAISAGIAASGADVYLLHVTTTPSISFVTRQEEFDCGIMITASHNPYYDNGIKIINRFGEKLDDETTSLIEAYLDGDLLAIGVNGQDIPLAKKEKIGCINDYISGRNRYIGYLIALASHSYKNLRIGLDCANGASWNIAKTVFSALGAQLYIIGAEPDGVNVNYECGSTHIDKLVKLVKDNHLDVGFAFDGDADRCIAVDEHGSIVDGDKIIYILANRLKRRGMLNEDTVVATVMSNSGFVNSLSELGIKCIQTSVGDRYVYECMQNSDYSLGGEQSGHIIMKKYATTGDGILTAIMLAEELCDQKNTLSELSKPVRLYPQYTKNLRVKNKELAVSDEDVVCKLEDIQKRLNGKGRALLRKSGTEPVIRIMIECEDCEKCVQYADELAFVIERGGHSDD